jgi:hypothetical protein
LGSNGDPLLLIQVKKLDSRPTDFGRSDDLGTYHGKVLFPAVLTGIEQFDYLACIERYCGDIGSFLALQSGQAKARFEGSSSPWC